MNGLLGSSPGSQLYDTPMDELDIRYNGQSADYNPHLDEVNQVLKVSSKSILGQ